MSSLLDKINCPGDLRELSIEELDDLSQEIREFIIQGVSQTGGHLASNLGVVDITLALHYVYDFARDHLLWDVGHQCYTHKILTGRREKFDRLRKKGGITGFPNPAESEHDRFSVGHAGTAIATAAGMALGAQHKKSDEKIVAFVGDASIVNGLSFEALNNLGLVKRQMLILLNDNSMAIDVTQGAIAGFLAKVRLNHTYEDIRKRTHNLLQHLPLIGKSVDHAIEKFKKSLRMAITPNTIFESMDIPYFGPVDGHDIPSLIELFRALAHLDTPAILHVYTRKGKGFNPADDNPCKFHSTGPFEIVGDEASFDKSVKKFTQSFSESITDLASANRNVTAITAAMPDGTGLIDFREKFPDRYFDVGIAESVAVDIAAGMAKQGLKPFVCIYSTFLQRAYDEIFQEVSLQNLGVVFCVDRAGAVGDDGPTHHGLMDIGFLRSMPNMQIIAPANDAEMKSAMRYAVSSESAVAIRYPRDVVETGAFPEFSDKYLEEFKKGCSISLTPGSSGPVIAALGPTVRQGLKAYEILKSRGVEAEVLSARFAKPIDQRLIEAVLRGRDVITVEDHNISCGFGSGLCEQVSARLCESDQAAEQSPGRIICIGAADEFIGVDSRSEQLKKMGICADNIVNKVLALSGMREIEHADTVGK